MTGLIQFSLNCRSQAVLSEANIKCSGGVFVLRGDLC